MADKKHRCGGTLRTQDVQIREERDGFTLDRVVPGLVCDGCGEELIDRKTMVSIQTIQTSHTPAISFKPMGHVANSSAVNLTLSATLPPFQSDRYTTTVP